MEMLQPLSYLVPATVIAGLALRAAWKLRHTFRGLREKAAEQQREVPPLATAYFNNTLRVLVVTGALFIAFAGSDALLHFAFPQPVAARALGYAGAFSLLVCSFALMLHSGVDRHLKLMDLFSRRGCLIAGAFGMCIAAWGMMLVTVEGGVWR